MNHSRPRFPWSRVGLLALSATPLALVACDPAVEDPVVSRGVEQPADAFPRYVRELVFVSELDGSPLVMPFSFVSADRGERIDRTARGWLGHGRTWEGFLDERWETSVAAAVWRIVPTHGLRILVGGRSEVEAVVYERPDRTLRLELGAPISPWHRLETARFRLLEAGLVLSNGTVSGTVVETQRLRRASADAPEAPIDFDWVYLTDGGDRRLLVVTPTGADPTPDRTVAWYAEGPHERRSERVELAWREMVRLEQARRDVPLDWEIRLAELGLQASAQAEGYHVDTGPERRGRRVVDVRYTLRGIIRDGGAGVEVFGAAHHVRR